MLIRTQIRVKLLCMFLLNILKIGDPLICMSGLLAVINWSIQIWYIINNKDDKILLKDI